ncbi:MAG: methylenetetrahydrofolate reductase C-terminal domain-containing protein [Melioribacteraceae bacterium]
MYKNIISKQKKTITPGERKLSRFILFFENVVKVPLFGCQHCGECILSSTAFVCSQQCPKHLRNGPCGGTGEGGTCEVYPEKKCVWYKIHKRSVLLGRVNLLYKFNKIHNWNLRGTASWLNIFKKRIDSPIWFASSFKKDKGISTGDS